MLSSFVSLVFSAGVTDKVSFRRFIRDRDTQIKDMFGYSGRAEIPSIASLVSASFHGRHPLIMLNYSSAAHNTLHHHPNGWSVPLRLCRGIVFDHNGVLVARGPLKFFNYGEMPETTDLPFGPFIVTQKHDGHLITIFRYAGEFVATTRGEFGSPTSQIACEKVGNLATKHNWDGKFQSRWSVCTEFIHPLTKVYVNYRGADKFVVLAVYESLGDVSGSDVSFNDRHINGYQYEEVRDIAKLLGLPVVEAWPGQSPEDVDDLVCLVNDRTVKNLEGYVARFANGLWVKFKFIDHLAKMVGAKLGHKYLMQRIISGNLEKMMKVFDGEQHQMAVRMLDDIRGVLRKEITLLMIQGKTKKPLTQVQVDRRTAQKRCQQLLNIIPKKKRNDSARDVCRKFTSFIQKNPGASF